MKSLRVTMTTLLALLLMMALVACGASTTPNDSTGEGLPADTQNDSIMATPDGSGDGDDTETMTETMPTDTEMMTDTDMMTDTEMMTDTDMMTPTMEAEATTAP